MKKYLVILFCLLGILGCEYVVAWNFLQSITPFPLAECWLTAVNGFLRDLLLLLAAGLLYVRRKRIKDRAKRYTPVVVVGVIYLCLAAFMVSYLELDKGFLTTLSTLTGLFDNLVVVLLAAMCYHHWPNKGMKIVYFLVYYLTCVIFLFDALYFWTTSMHVESVVFANLNYYSLVGFTATMASWQLAGIAFLLICFLFGFRIAKPTRKKPNFTWSLLCVVLFGLTLNLSYALSSSAVYQIMDAVPGLGLEVDLEKSRKSARDQVVMPVNINFFHKAFFSTDKVMKRPEDFKARVLTEKDKEVLQGLGIVPEREPSKPSRAAYDKVVLLVLESVHRDYINYYNPKIPKETTPFLNSLLGQTLKLNHYYSSAIPTTQGLNATFRSQLIYDPDLPGAKQASIFRTAGEVGWKGIFLNASSRYYNKEYLEYPQQFGMEQYLAREDLEHKGYKGASGWGFHNDVMYDATLKLLAKHKQDKLFLVTKTLDMHQPYPYYGYQYNEMPESVRTQGTITVCGMYWVDQTLRHFFEEAEKNGLMDERTLFIITSDHNPHSGGEYKTLVESELDTLPISPIPLIFVGKNLAPLYALEQDAYASQEDLAPTLLSLMGLPTPPEFMGRNLLHKTAKPYALGYFGGKAYYYAADKNFIATLDEPTPDTAEKDSLANYVMFHYVKRHIHYLK